MADKTLLELAAEPGPALEGELAVESPSYIRIDTGRPANRRRVHAVKAATVAACVVVVAENAAWPWTPWLLAPAAVAGTVVGAVFYWFPSLARRARAIANHR